MRGFCGINHTQGYGTVTLMVTGCLSSETAVFLLMETSDNGCSNRTTLSNNCLSRRTYCNYLLEIKLPAYERKLKVNRWFETVFHFK